MLANTQKLEVSAEDLDMIEAALHTQSQILNVQARAGGTQARTRLNTVKRLLASIAQQRPPEPRDCTAATPRGTFAWLQALGGFQSRC